MKRRTLLIVAGALSFPGSAIAAQQILLQPLASPESRIFLYVPDLKKTAAGLKRRGIAFQSAKHSLTVTDPDGNFLVFTTDKTAA